MHVQPPISWRDFPALSKEAIGDGNSYVSYAKAIARAQRACPHDGDRRRFDAYSDRERCTLCGLELELPPLPSVDLHDAGSDLAWAVAFVKLPPSQPGVIALVALSHAVRHADASWSMQVFGAERAALRALGFTPARYLKGGVIGG